MGRDGRRSPSPAEIPRPTSFRSRRSASAPQAVIAREGRTILNYGPAGGYPPLREWIAAQHGVEPSQVVISTGSLAGFNFLMRAPVRGRRPGRHRGAELRPHDRRPAAASAPTIESVPLTDAGLDLDRLESLLATGPYPEAALHDPDLPEPVGPDALARAAPCARRARAGEGLPRLRGRPVPSRPLLRAIRCRACTSSPAGRASSSRRRSRRRALRAFASATWSCRPSS